MSITSRITQINSKKHYKSILKRMAETLETNGTILEWLAIEKFQKK